MTKKRAILWFRQDLRLHDNEALTDALQHADEVLPIYVFDERIFFGKTRYGFPKTDKYRAKFIIDSIYDLKQSLKKLNSDLIVRIGKPEEIIFDIANTIKSSWIFCNRERTAEEVAVQDNLEYKLWSIGQEMRYSRGKMLYYTADLPFPVTHTPDIFTHFRKEVEKFIKVRHPLPRPEKSFAPLTCKPIDSEDIPTLDTFGLAPIAEDSRSVLPFKGGETAGLARLKDYFWDGLKHPSTYKKTRNEMIGANYSTKFSAWLAQGCLSPKRIYHELKAYEAEHGSNSSTYWVFFELLWRDFFRLMGKKYGSKIFLKGGTKGEVEEQLKDDKRLLELWIEGRTGVPLIDANMKEIAATGFMSNRGRQIVASFLVKDLKVNWQMGAEYFESILIDYDPCSNWGNWNYVAGIGSDPRENRYFNILSQARKYDPQGDYVKLWLPELTELPADKVHRPDILSFEEQEELHVKLGTDYPKAMISTSRWT